MAVALLTNSAFEIDVVLLSSLPPQAARRRPAVRIAAQASPLI
jgi:hypothetical protein